MSELGNCEQCQRPLVVSSGAWQHCLKCKIPVWEADVECPGCHGPLERKIASVVCCGSCGFPVPNHEALKGMENVQPKPLHTSASIEVPLLDPLSLHRRILALEEQAKSDALRISKLEKMNMGTRKSA